MLAVKVFDVIRYLCVHLSLTYPVITQLAIYLQKLWLLTNVYIQHTCFITCCFIRTWHYCGWDSSGMNSTQSFCVLSWQGFGYQYPLWLDIFVAVPYIIFFHLSQICSVLHYVCWCPILKWPPTCAARLRYWPMVLSTLTHHPSLPKYHKNFKTSFHWMYMYNFHRLSKTLA